MVSIWPTGRLSYGRDSTAKSLRERRGTSIIFLDFVFLLRTHFIPLVHDFSIAEESARASSDLASHLVVLHRSSCSQHKTCALLAIVCV